MQTKCFESSLKYIIDINLLMWSFYLVFRLKPKFISDFGVLNRRWNIRRKVDYWCQVFWISCSPRNSWSLPGDMVPSLNWWLCTISSADSTIIYATSKMSYSKFLSLCFAVMVALNNLDFIWYEMGYDFGELCLAFLTSMLIDTLHHCCFASRL